ncbi:hypothetical protein H0H92_009246 [Tricholoma furcatifolium]|nr:hypothetical protein H0H92_009246 [Tricholoma furcatifolium]
MFKRAGTVLRPNLRRIHSKASSSARTAREHLRAHPGLIITSSAVAASILWYANSRPIYNDAAAPIAMANVMEKQPGLILGADVAESEDLRTVVWGSNKSNTLTMEPSDSIRSPSAAKWLNGVALRDLVIHKDSAACVDSKGDVYQWGDGFASEHTEKGKPILTLREKNITQLKLTEGKLFALSASGKVYALSTDSAKQKLRPGSPTPSSDSWWGTGWFWGEDETVDFVEIVPNEHLAWGEKIVSIDAGDHHLLALTSKGRAFAHPVDKKANAFGQLGFRKFKIPNPAIHHHSPTNGHLDVELIPKSLADPFINSTRSVRPNPAPTTSENLFGIDDSSIRFCTNFFEIPALKEIEMAQLTAGARTSFARTLDGRVLGWGANDFGQTGLGSNVALDTITVPTEVVLWKSSATRGDLTAFVVEITDKSSPTTIDLLICGNGQWGGLGSNTFSTSQGTPLRAKNVSGLLECKCYSDKTQSLQPIAPDAVTISPTGHVLLTLNTGSTTGVGGRDLVVWGKNYESELGNGKKSSLAVPTTLVTPEGGHFMLHRRKAKQVLDLHAFPLTCGRLLPSLRLQRLQASHQVPALTADPATGIMATPNSHSLASSTCSDSSTFVMLSKQTSADSHHLDDSDHSDDEIIYTVSESDSFLSAPESPNEYDSASDDGFVVLSPPKSQASILETEPSTPEEQEQNKAGTPGIADLTKGLANLSVKDASVGHGKRKTKVPKAAAVPGGEKKKKKKKSKKSKKGAVPPIGKPSAAKPSLTPSSMSPRSMRSQPASPTSSVSSEKQIEGKSKKTKKGGHVGLGGRSIVDDVSDKFSDYGESDVGSPSMYEEAFGFISSFLSNPDARSNSMCRLTLLQALIIELGLAPSSLPTSLTAAKAYLKSRAFLNIREYLAVRDQGPAAVQRIMHPSRTALIKDIRKKQNKAPLGWVKESGLQVLLVQCYH